VAVRRTTPFPFCQQTLTAHSPRGGLPHDAGMDIDEISPEAAHDDEGGQGMVEYALIVILVAIGALIALQVLGHATNNLYSNIQTSLPH